MKKLLSWVLLVGPRNVATSVAELAGGACLTVGAAMIFPPAGWIVAGLFVFAAGVAGGRP